MFYKLINNNSVIGVATNDSFRKIGGRNNVVMYATNDVEFAEYNLNYYRDTWFRPLPDGITIQVYPATFIEITEEEYNALAEALETNEEIPYEEPEEEIPAPEEIDENSTLTLEYVRNAKIAAMSKACNQAITSGIDVILSDGESHHFSLEIEDQIKIQALAMKAQAGDTLLPWHEDNQLCKFYSAEDVLRIYSGLEQTQTYHTTYFNSLKPYIMSLDNITDIGNIYYGIEIPEEYQSEVLKYLIAGDAS